MKSVMLVWPICNHTQSFEDGDMIIQSSYSGVSKGGPGGAMAPPEIFLAPSLVPPLFKRYFVNFYHLLRKGFCQVSEFDGLTFSQDLNVSLLPATEIVIILYY